MAKRMLIILRWVRLATGLVVLPGQRADLTVTFDANFHPTKDPVTRLVWFATNGPTQPWVEVRIAADVR